MNITFYSNVTTKEEVLRYIPELKEHNIRFVKLSDKELLTGECSDTQILIVDAMGVVDKKVISSMPELKLIQSEGVGY